ncbi:MAG: glycosyltransferase family 9 protein [Trueperaceae bacterium]
MRQENGIAGWQSARRLLAVRLDAMGDVVMTGPALRALKDQLPGRHVTLLTSPAGAEAASLLPEVDESIVFQAPWMKPSPAGPGPAPTNELADRLRAGAYDAAVIFTVYSQSPLPAALLLHLAEIPRALAYCRENPYHLLDRWIREPEPDEGVRHEVERHLRLVGTIGATTSDRSLRVTARGAAHARVESLLQHLRLRGRHDWLVVHPGASAPSRRYPVEQFAQALHLLHREHGLGLVLTGSEEERHLVSEVRRLAGVPATDLAGELDLHELVALLERAPLLLANNTGPVHLAAGVGTPVVDLYALTNPQHTPWRVPSRVLFRDVPCRFCYSSRCPEGHHECLRGVAPGEVAAAVLDLFGETGSGVAAASDRYSSLRLPGLTGLP